MLAPVAARAGFTSIYTLGSGDAGKTLQNNTIYKVESDLTLTNTGTGPGLSVASGATVVLYIKKGVTLTVNGGNSSGRSAGDAGLRVLSGRTLVVTGGGKLVATGGNAGNGVNGGDAGSCSLNMSGDSHGGQGGAGGNGGAGASAGIGGYGGYGGYGGSSPSDESWVETNDTDDYDRDGHNGNGGDAGGNGDDMGTVYLLGSLNVTATGGSGGSGGSPGGNTGGEHDSNWSGVNWYYVGGAGGGGGGAGGIAAPYAIGGGGGGGGGGGSGGNGGLYWKGSGGTGTANKPDGAGGQGGWDNGVSSSRTEPDYAQSSSGTKYKHGGYRGSGGAKGANGGNGTLYRDSGVTLNATYASATSATTHSAIEYLLVFDDAQRVYEAHTARFGYAYPTAPIPPSRPGWTFNGWFTEKNGGGTKYYNADGTATAVEWTTCSDVTLYASWTLTDPDAAASIWINGTALVGGTSTSGYGWDYNGADGRLTLTASTGSYVITGKDETGEFSIYAAANLCTVVMSNLTMNASKTIARPPFESVSGRIATLQFEGVNKLTGCSGYPAIYVAEGSSVTIGGAGQVEAIGGANAAGIGGRTGETAGTATLNIMGGTIIANGGANGSGIGAAKSAGFGITTISGGTITATGKDGAAGIGGSQGAGMGTYIISGGAVTAKGGTGGPGIGSGRNAIGGTVKITGGSVTATGGYYAAAIGCGQYGSSFNVEISGGEIMATGDSGRNSGAGIGGSAATTNLTISVSGGTITARGGKAGAGIGGGHKSKDVSISVTGGNIVAVGGNYGAGIGAGDGDIGDSQNVTISISGGLIEADGGINAAGIGSGDYASCGAITISGGTVNVTADTGAKKIGNGRDGYGKASSVTITGGAVYPALAQVSPAPTNSASKAVFPVDFEIGEATNKVTSLTLSGALSGYSYGVNDAYTDANGNLRVWLPATSGVAFMAKVVMASGNTYYFSFDIDDKGNVSVRGYLVVNDGVVASNVDNSGSGWSFAKDTGVVTISADAVVQGFSTNGEYRIVVPSASSASAMTLRKLTLVGPVKQNASAMDFERNVALTFSGTNVITGTGRYSAGIEVASAATLTINGGNNAAAQNGVALFATGGQYGAGIGSSGYDKNNPSGKIVIESGTIVAQGGEKAAGIGGGSMANLAMEGNIVISGGNITAAGGSQAAGIGSGYMGGGTSGKTLADGAVKISGGTVLATRGASATSDLISSGNSVPVTGYAKALYITGGSVHGANNSVAPNPVDADGTPLRYMLFTNLTVGAEAKFVSPDIPAAYGMNDVVADSTGSICLWLPQTNMVRAVNVNGLHFSGGGTTNNVFDAKSGSTEPVDRREEGSVTRWRVKVPGLEPNAAVTLQIGVDYRTLTDKAEADGNYFFYVADGRYLFKANGLDYSVIVDGADAVALRIDLTPTGVYADGIDVSEGLGYGWRYDFATSNLVVASDGIVLSGTNTAGRVRVSIEADMALTVSNLVLAATNAAAVSVKAGVSASIVLCGDSRLEGGSNHAALEGASDAALSIGGGGALVANGGENGAGIGGGMEAAFGAVRIVGGTVTANGGKNAAGIGGGYKGLGGAVQIDGGTVTATGGENGAGIGGGWRGMNNSISIKGGDVTAQGGSQASAIGPGDSHTAFFPTGDTISISGGIVRVNSGSSDAAAVGCSRYGSCGKISISGGTVLFPGNQQCHIGDGRQSRPESVTITGGSIAAERKKIYPLPTDGSKVLWRVTVDTGTANKKIDITGLGDYGVKDISSDDAGNIYLWLPNGEYAFSADGENYFAIVADADTVAARELPPLGLRVNGEDIAQRKGDGWFYDSDGVLTLSGLAGYALEADDPSYSNLVRVVVRGTTAVSVSNVVVASTVWRESALVVESGADATLTLFGTNVFVGAATGGAPGIAVRESAVLTIGGEGALVATGGQYGAGIGSVGPWGDYLGGGEGTAFGTIRIVGGNVTATGGQSSAGIGSGLDGRGGTVEISGGTVTATGWGGGAGIGSGREDGVGVSTTISGGLITANGSSGGAGIGGGQGSSGNAVSIVGGDITAKGGTAAPGIGTGDQLGAYKQTGDTISISGGIIWVQAHVGASPGFVNAASIGCSDMGSCGAISISGGTIMFAENQLWHIGAGRRKYATAESVTISGGSIAAKANLIDPAPSNGVDRVYRVTVDVGATNGMVTVSGIDGYGTNDIMADGSGRVYLWLPEGVSNFSAGGYDWIAIVDGDDAVAAKVLPPLGFRVNGEDIGLRKRDGWFYAADGVLTLSGLSDYVLESDDPSISNQVRVVVGQTSAVSVSNVVLASAVSYQSPLMVQSGAAVTLTLFGTNYFAGAYDAAGVGVANNASLTIDGEGSLAAQGGEYGAGIGGGYRTTGCAVTIAGGVITATGGERGAGIGGGCLGTSNTVTIVGGDITAFGGMYGAGIGSGDSYGYYDQTYDTISISGGIVRAWADTRAASIGGSYQRVCGDVSITGGTVMPVDGGKLRIGGFVWGVSSGPVTITGGSIAAEHANVSPAPSNGVEGVCHVTVAAGGPNRRVQLSGLGGYGTDDIYTDAGGVVHLWLPPGSYAFQVDGEDWTAEVVGVENKAWKVGAGPDSLRIEEIAVEDGKVTLVVSAEPDGWLTEATAPQLRVRAAAELPLPGGNAALLPREDVEISANGDGTATATVPRAADAPQMFYDVEAP